MSYQDLQRMAIAAVDDVMAETLDIFPLRNGAADPSRERTSVRAPLRVGSSKNENLSGNQTGSWSGRISAGQAEAGISYSAYSELVIRQGDRLRAMDRSGQPWFEVASVQDRVYGRLTLTLNEA